MDKGSARRIETISFRNTYTDMKGTKMMVYAIKLYLDTYALKNPRWKEKYESKDKNIEDCVTYILNQVQDSGSNGFHDSEIFGMALHYYDEKKIDIGKAINMKVKVNRFVEITNEERADLIKEAREKVVNEEMAKMRKKPVKKKSVPTPQHNANKFNKEHGSNKDDKVKEAPKPQQSLF